MDFKLGSSKLCYLFIHNSGVRSQKSVVTSTTVISGLFPIQNISEYNTEPNFKMKEEETGNRSYKNSVVEFDFMLELTNQRS